MAAKQLSGKATEGFQALSPEEHARKKGMWAGALTRITGDYPGLERTPEGDTRLIDLALAHCPALFKCADELIVNATDHERECRANPPSKRVTSISVTLDEAMGWVTVENDGPGIPVVVHEEVTAATGRPVYIPELVYAIMLAGTNMDKAADNIKGGTNGVGGKLPAIHSSEAVAETVDAERGLLYIQIYRDQMREVSPPSVFKLKRTAPKGPDGKAYPDPPAEMAAERRKAHTRYRFMPTYTRFGYAGDAAAMAEVGLWLRWRAALAAVYAGPKVHVTYNGEHLACYGAVGLSGIYAPGLPVMELAFAVDRKKHSDHPGLKHPWSVGVAITGGSKFLQVSIINGVHCSKGNHVTYAKKLLTDAVTEQIQKVTKDRSKKLTVAEAMRGVVLTIVAALPGAEWGGQRKDELMVSQSVLSPYAPAKVELKRVADAIVESRLRAAEKGTVKKKKIVVDKYEPARKAGTARSADCALLAAEGDSPLTSLRAGLTLGERKNPGGPTFEHYGLFSLGGVIINADKQTTEVAVADTEDANATILVRSEKLRNNKTLKALGEVLGLDYTKTYGTEAERRTLRYGKLVICVDQDLDGIGKILVLLLAYINRFWPALIACGFVQRLMTPVIRVYTKTRGSKAATVVKEFLYESEAHAWIKENGGPKAVGAAYELRYFKGLASHEDDEVADMFRRFRESVYTFTLADGDNELFTLFFGGTPAGRKDLLRTPVAWPGPDVLAAQARARALPCTQALMVDSKAYKQEAISRQLPNAIDGGKPAMTKVLAGAMLRFAQSNKAVKVFQLGGYVADQMAYHHGDASLNGTITGMAQYFIGANLYPVLVGLGQFGTRLRGGKDAGSPRYISVRLAKQFVEAMYPSADKYLLPYVFEDGERAQPMNFVPTLPMAILESGGAPSEAWAYKRWARRLDHVVALVEAIIAGDPDVSACVQCAADWVVADPTTRAAAPAHDSALLARVMDRFPLDIELGRYGAHLEPEDRERLVRPYKGKLYSFGFYDVEVDKSGAHTIVVTELPMGVATRKFVEDLEKESAVAAKVKRAALIDDVDDRSSDTQVCVRIMLKAGGYESICEGWGSDEIDPVEDCFGLRVSLNTNLNLYQSGGGVLELGSRASAYHEALFYWAPHRRDLYRYRLERERAILRMQILREREVLRYVPRAAALDLAKLDDETAAAARLEAEGFPRLDSGLIREPKYTPYSELERLALNGHSASYNYILDLAERELIASNTRKRFEKLAALEERLCGVEAALIEKPFPGASLWAEDLRKTLAAIEFGLRTEWKFETK